ELIYSHIARTPVPVFEIRQDIPQAISLVIDKLLKKSPDERYQTASGVKTDLLSINEAISEGRKIVDFKPGQAEYSGRIVLSSKLYGREKETDRLLDCFLGCRDSGHVVTVTGPAGIGKTALIRELYAPITTLKGFFLSGKFDQLKKGLAYTALSDALKEFVGQCCGQDIESLEIWRSTVQSSVGGLGQVLIDIIPEFQYLIGKQQSIAPVSPLETIARRNSVFSNLINDICAIGRPMVIFLDDLQWADSATLSLIENIIEKNPTNLLIILSYRDNEISPDHPVKLFIDSILNKEILLSTIHLNSLSEESVAEWITDIFSDDSKRTDKIAASVMTKTAGNPFYVTSLLHLIIEKSYINRFADGTLSLDMDAITNIPADTDVVKHLIRKIESLETREAELLTKLSVLGNRFSFNTIALFLGEKHDFFQDAIKGLVSAHLLIKSGDTTIFAHDRVQQAARAMLDEDKASTLHLQAGQNIKVALDDRDSADEHIEEYIHHYNAAADLITNVSQRLELAKLNTTLGKQQKSNAAYQSAESSFAQAIAFLPLEPFETDYNLAIDLFTEYGEVLFLNLKYEEGEKHFDTVINHSKSPLDSAKVYVKQINHHTSNHNPEKAMKMALHALEMLDVKLPKRLLKVAIVKDLMKVKVLLKNKKPEDVLDFPVTDDPLVFAQLNVLTATAAPAYMGYPDYYPIIIFKMLRISIARGNCSMSPFAYANYALILCSLGEVDTGYAYGRAALALMDNINAKDLVAKVQYVFGTYVHHWKAPVRNTEEYYDKLITNGLKTGDYEFASYAANVVMYNSFYFGKSIYSLLDQYPKQHKILAGFGKEFAIYSAKYFNQLLIAMNDPTGDGITVSGDILDENWLIPLLEERQDLISLAFCMIAKMQLAYLTGDYKIAQSFRSRAFELLKVQMGTVFIPICHFFSALTCVAYYRKHKKDASLLRDAKRSLKKLKKYGADAPKNYLYKAQLVEAELLSVKEKQSEALSLYEAAIENAEEAGNSLDLGIACECMGRYLESIGLNSMALVYIRRSIAVFDEWGALNKSNRLSREYGITISKDDLFTMSIDSVHSPQEINVMLNLEALAGTIKSLTSDFKFDSLLETLLNAVMQSSGATRVVYIHVEQENLAVRAEKLESGNVRVCNGKDTHPTSFGLPSALLEKCYLGSCEHVLDNIKVERKSREDEQNKAGLKSVLIMPLIRHKSVKGFVYLENDLMEDAFRNDQVQFLSLIAGQAAIAIENATVFEHLNAERYYSSNIIQNSPSLICGIDGNGITTFINPVIEKISGYRNDELIGANWWELFYPGEEYEQVDRLFKTFAGGEVANYEMHLTCKNGDKRDIIWNSLTKRDNNNNILEIVGFGNDITERKRSAEALRRSEAKFRGLIESSSDWIWEVNTEGVYTYASPKVEEMLGYKPEEVVGKTPFDMMPPEEVTNISKIFKEFLGKGEPIVALENVAMHKDGHQLVLETSGVPVLDEAGKISGYRGVDRDITERKALEEQLRQSEKMQAIGQLAGGIAHDFNNQLSGILGYADMMRKDADDNPALTQHVDNIIVGVKRASDLTAQLLAFSRKGKYLTVVLDLHRIINEVVNILRHSIDKRITIRKEFHANPSTTTGDPTQLQSVMLNLALNARDAMPDGGELTFATDVVELDKNYCDAQPFEIVPGKYLLVSVSDSGTGMDDNTKHRIFEPFFTTKEPGKGTGMGLAAVYGIVKSHKSSIQVTSELGRGSTFELRLPLVLEGSVADAPSKLHHELIEAQAHILLVDDEKVIRDVTTHILEQLGHTISVRRNGKEAVTFYKEHWQSLDLVILDMVMPVMGGRQTFIAMREINPDVIVLLSSGHSIDDEAQSVIIDGAKGFIQKPYRMGELSQKLSEILQISG
ncbi:MAG: PAS domain S-box protein, partial [Planctomycetes bacterium]|nr:PAS domain S-box protein [Planctomycetota bacterium]